MPAAANASKIAGASRSATAGSDHELLGRERDALEPGQQIEGEAQTRIGELGQVSVGVDHPGEKDPRPQVDCSGDHLGCGVPGGADGGDPARFIDHQQPVGLVPGPAGRQWRQEVERGSRTAASSADPRRQASRRAGPRIETTPVVGPGSSAMRD